MKPVFADYRTAKPVETGLDWTSNYEMGFESAEGFRLKAGTGNLLVTRLTLLLFRIAAADAAAADAAAAVGKHLRGGGGGGG